MDKQIEITEDDLWLFFIQKNLWPKVDFDEFKRQMKEQGVIILNETLSND